MSGGGGGSWCGHACGIKLDPGFKQSYGLSKLWGGFSLSLFFYGRFEVGFRGGVIENKELAVYGESGRLDDARIDGCMDRSTDRSSPA
jgi:hypothetical protein